jgi:hypothetical protein
MKKALTVFAGVFLAVLLISVGTENAGWRKAPQEVPAIGNLQGAKIETDYGKMPLYFIPNRGQMDEQVAYYVQGKDKTLYFTPGGITFALTMPAQEGEVTSRLDPARSTLNLPEQRSKAQEAGSKEANGGLGRGTEHWVVKLEFAGADKSVKPVGEAETGAVVSYFKGKPEEWRTGLPTYSKIIYPNLWPGIDLVYYGTVNRLKYEFVVHPGADPSKIRLAYRGAQTVSVDGEGRLEVMTPAGKFQDDKPIAYQEIEGKRIDIDLSYELEGFMEKGIGGSELRHPATPKELLVTPISEAYEYGFEIGTYIRTLPLIIDPAVLIYCGYIGGDSGEIGSGIAVDSYGNEYIVGETNSTEATFPIAAGPYLTFSGDAESGVFDAFVAKVNAAGSSLVYCGYIGGERGARGNGIAVDGSGNAYITGETLSDEKTFPVFIGPDLTVNEYINAFAAKINASGTGLDYCGYIGGHSSGNGIAVDGSGNAYITGQTASDEKTFPVVVGPDLTFNGDYDAFVAKVKSDGTSLVYCGYIGGSNTDWAWGIAIDVAGNAYVTGETASDETTFPVSSGPDLTLNGDWDAFVAKVNSVGTSLIYCGYIGGSSDDAGHGIAVDSWGNGYITGLTYSSEVTFPVCVGPDLTFNGDLDAFIAKVDQAGVSLVYCGYLGGSSYDAGWGIAVDAAGNAFVTGVTGCDETTFPALLGPDDTYNGGPDDAFIAKVNVPGIYLLYCGYIGGASADEGYGIAVDSTGNVHVTGCTRSNQSSFPAGVGPDLIYNGGEWDVFVAKISYWDVWTLKHAAGDFDGDGAKEVAVDFGLNGVYLYDSGTWVQISSANPENLLAVDMDADSLDEVIADLGASGLWLWNAGAWNQLSGVNVEGLATGDVDADGADEVVGDFGGVGLWLLNGGAWTQMSGVNADYVTVANVDGDGGDEIFGDFGATGLWVWNSGTWSILSGVNADYVMTGLQTGARFILGDFGPTGLWLWAMPGICMQLSGLDADYLIAANTDGDTEDEIIGDFGATGLWHCEGGLWTGPGFTWTILSGVNADFMIRADVDGNGTDEVVADFGTLGLWLCNSGAWTQASGVNPEYHMAADLDDDNKDEILADFGALGLWLWNEGVWSQISTNNPD